MYVHVLLQVIMHTNSTCVLYVCKGCDQWTQFTAQPMNTHNKHFTITFTCHVFACLCLSVIKTQSLIHNYLYQLLCSCDSINKSSFLFLSLNEILNSFAVKIKKERKMKKAVKRNRTKFFTGHTKGWYSPVLCISSAPLMSMPLAYGPHWHCWQMS